LPNKSERLVLIIASIVVSLFYTLISASLAELASSIPSAGGVYHWSSVLSKKHGRAAGFFTTFIPGHLSWAPSFRHEHAKPGHPLIKRVKHWYGFS